MTHLAATALPLLGLVAAWLALNVIAPVAEQRRTTTPTTARHLDNLAWALACAALLLAWIGGRLQ